MLFDSMNRRLVIYPPLRVRCNCCSMKLATHITLRFRESMSPSISLEHSPLPDLETGRPVIVHKANVGFNTKLSKHPSAPWTQTHVTELSMERIRN